MTGIGAWAHHRVVTRINEHHNSVIERLLNELINGKDSSGGSGS